MNDPGCTMMKCTDFKDGVCHYDSDICKYQECKRCNELEMALEKIWKWITSKSNQVDKNEAIYQVCKQALYK
jgi:hypothetical protein